MALPEAAQSSPWLLHPQCVPEMSLHGLCLLGLRKVDGERRAMQIPAPAQTLGRGECESLPCFSVDLLGPRFVQADRDELLEPLLTLVGAKHMGSMQKEKC